MKSFKLSDLPPALRAQLTNPSSHAGKPAIVSDPIAIAEREHRFAPPRRWRFDYAWLPQKVALEVEGGVWTGGRHTRGAGFLKDVEKYNQAVMLGWRVVRCTPQTLHSPETLAMLRALL